MVRKYFVLNLFLFCVLITGCATGNLEQGKMEFAKEQYLSAFHHLLPLAKQGNPDAEYAVGYMYYYGKGTIEDPRKAQYWITKAAKDGQSQACSALATQTQDTAYAAMH